MRKALRSKGLAAPYHQYLQAAYHAAKAYGGNMWFVPDGLAGVYQDIAGTTPVTAAGQKLGKVSDVVGANHATQGTVGSMPTLVQVPRRLGPELVVNGTFDSGAGWNPGVGWVISGGVATCTSSTININRAIPFATGKAYLVTFDVTVTSGSIRAEAGLSFGPTMTSSGRYSAVLMPTGGEIGTLYIYGPSAFTGAIDNISVREVLEWDWRMQFDGVDDKLVTTIQQPASNFTLIASGYQTDLTDQRMGFANAGPTAGLWMQNNGTYEAVQGAGGGGSLASAASVIDTNVPHVLTYTNSASAKTLYRDGSNIATGSTSLTVTTAADALLALGNAGANYTGGYGAGVYSLFAYIPAAIPASDRIAIERFAAYQAGAPYAY